MSRRVRTVSPKMREVSRGDARMGRDARGIGVAPGVTIAPGVARVGRENTVESDIRGRVVSGNGVATGARRGSGEPTGGKPNDVSIRAPVVSIGAP